jgi:hypothetical protein
MATVKAVWARLNFRMIAWATVSQQSPSHGGDRSIENGDNEINSRYEYRIRCDYETAIQQLSSSTFGDENWNQIKQNLEALLRNLDLFTNLEQKKQLTYLAFKNLASMKEKEGDYHGAFQDALSALSNSNSKEETALLVRIAYLSLQSGEVWTCQALLSSGYLSKALRPVIADLRKKCDSATLSISSNNFPPPIRPIPMLEVPIVESPVESLPLPGLRLLSLLKAMTVSSQRSEWIQNPAVNILFTPPPTLCNQENTIALTIDTQETASDDPDPTIGSISAPNSIENENKNLRKSSRQSLRKMKEVEFDYSSSQLSTPTTVTAADDALWESVLNDLQVRDDGEGDSFLIAS